MTPADKLVAADVRRRFAALVSRPNRELDLAEAALLVAAEDEPRLDVTRFIALLDELGGRARARMEQAGGGSGGYSSIEAFNDFMFDELGFAGNQINYYDPRNSLLNHVLERRRGIPITLSVVYMEVGRRAGLRMEGVGLPGHFIVRAHLPESTERIVLIDPFYGSIIDEDDCQQRLDVIYNGQIQLTGEHLRAVTTREILIRLLNNLKAVYTKSRLYRRALAAVERILLLDPHLLDERRDRSSLLAHLGRAREAIIDAQTYLNLAPRAPDAEQVREQLKNLQLQRAMLN